MKRCLFLSLTVCCLIFNTDLFAQNYTAISASNVADLNGNKLAAGTICFTATDQYDNPINFMVGGGGTILKRPFCFNISNGGITSAIGGGSLQVPNPQNTSPTGVLYRIQARDALTNQLVIDYRKVGLSGTSFNLDSYAPTGVALIPVSGGHSQWTADCQRQSQRVRFAHRHVYSRSFHVRRARFIGQHRLD